MYFFKRHKVSIPHFTEMVIGIKDNKNVAFVKLKFKKNVKKLFIRQVNRKRLE